MLTFKSLTCDGGEAGDLIFLLRFRLDRYRGDPKEEHKDSFDFESHIFVDDAFMTQKGTGKRLVNEYVEDLIHVVTEVYRYKIPM